MEGYDSQNGGTSFEIIGARARSVLRGLAELGYLGAFPLISIVNYNATSEGEKSSAENALGNVERSPSLEKLCVLNARIAEQH